MILFPVPLLLVWGGGLLNKFRRLVAPVGVLVEFRGDHRLAAAERLLLEGVFGASPTSRGLRKLRGRLRPGGRGWRTSGSSVGHLLLRSVPALRRRRLPGS